MITYFWRANKQYKIKEINKKKTLFTELPTV